MQEPGVSSAWSTAEPFDAMGAPDQHDFSLLDFENIDLDFGYSNNAGSDASQQLGRLAEELDVQHLHNPFSPTVTPDHRNATPGAPHAENAMSQPNAYFDFSIPPYMQNTPAFSHPHEHNAFRQQGPVPPTPSSVEMHADSVRYMQHMDAQQVMFEQRYQMRKGESPFTPLVSPAVTPHEGRFGGQDMTAVPGTYFSPLTSPALAAQNHPHAPAYSSQYGTTSGSSASASPNDIDMDVLDDSAMAPQEQGRKLRSANKRSVPRSNGAPARIRQSPIMKPGRRKATVCSLIPPKEVSDLLDEAQGHRPSSGCDMQSSRGSPMADSISPEPLSDMGPPPKPGSVTQSPAILPEAQQNSGHGVSPATPASLMRIQPSPTFGVPEMLPTLDDLTLPEASMERPPLARIDTAIATVNETPRMTARKTPKLGALSTPSGPTAQAGRSPAHPSPMLSAVSTPTSPAFGAMSQKKDIKSGRGTKKRNSVGSNLVSPALRPKISPSIKPLLPGGAQGDVSGDTHTLLLASKSNYQNILDGTTVPGVVYPTSLSTNLTSKRTSHKIAEQGRRNRINTALQEMQALLPLAQQVKEGKSPENSAQSNNSKAAKVESAIGYIKELQKEVSDKDQLLAAKDQEMEALRKELAALKQRGPSADRSSPQAAATPTTPTTQENTPSKENVT